MKIEVPLDKTGSPKDPPIELVDVKTKEYVLPLAIIPGKIDSKSLANKCSMLSQTLFGTNWVLSFIEDHHIHSTNGIRSQKNKESK